MATSEPELKKTRSDRNRRYYERKKAEGVTSNKTAPKTPFKVTDAMLAYSQVGASKPEENNLFVAMKKPPPWVPSSSAIAMDDAITTTASWAGSAYGGGLFGQGFVGVNYAYLSELALIPEFRKISEIISTEMTRRWIKVQASSDDDDKNDEIDKINAALDEFRVRDVFREAAQLDGEFGRGHIFIDLGVNDNPNELSTPIGNGRDGPSQTKVTKGSIKGIRSVEALWVYPKGYNSTNPLDADFYKPQAWLVNGKEVHHTRLLTVVGREVPDLLKPSYMFGGLSLTQVCMTAVENWRRTRGSVSDAIHKFSVNCLATNLTEALQSQGAGDQLFKRAQLFNNFRDNSGLFIFDKEMEDFLNVSMPLSTLDHLQAQSQEQMASVAGIPLVKLLGITPSGLNASSDGEIRVFYDWIAAYQQHLFKSALDAVMGFIQLHLFGEIDPGITYKFEPLWSLDEKEEAEVRQIEANTDIVLVESGILLPKESRTRLANDPDSPYQGLVVDELPDPPEPEAMGEGESLPVPLPKPGESANKENGSGD